MSCIREIDASRNLVSDEVFISIEVALFAVESEHLPSQILSFR